MSAVIFYSFEEIKKNNGKDGSRIWIVYKDSVYDVTDYVENVSLNCNVFFVVERRFVPKLPCRDKKQ